MGRWEEAVGYMKRGLARQEQSLEPDHPLLAYSLLNLGVVFTNKDRLDEAEAYLKRSVAIMGRVVEPDDFRLALTQYDLATLYFRRGDIDDAERLGRVAMNSFQSTLEPTHQYVGFASQLLADVHHAKGLDVEAESYYEQALAVFGPRPVNDPVRANLIKEYTAFLRATGRDQRALELLEGSAQQQDP